MHVIQVTRSSMPSLDEYMDEIKDIWDTHILTNMGSKHMQLEKALTQYLEAPNITLFVNGHLALECAIAALELSGEVITTPFTFASTVHAIVRNGLEPVFCDINPDDYTMDVDKIEGLITEKTTAILPVHVYGNLCNVDAIERLARKHHIKVIYDAAHAFGVSVCGRSSADFGDITMFSFHATKVFNTIEGGALAYHDIELKKRLDALQNFGITGYESVEYIGGNAKMNEFQAAMGLCNLRHIDDEIEKRKALTCRYLDRLEGVRGIKLTVTKPDTQSNYAYFPVVFEGFPCNRNEIFDILASQGVCCRKYFYPLATHYACYRDRFLNCVTPVADRIAEHVLTLPLYADLPMEEVDSICDIILRQAYRQTSFFSLLKCGNSPADGFL